MEAERAKVQELQDFHAHLSKQLADSKTLEIEQRRNLLNASDELDALKKQHAKEVMGLEIDRSKLQREVQELKEEFRVCTEDLSRERESITILKVWLSFPDLSPKYLFFLHTDHYLAAVDISTVPSDPSHCSSSDQ